MGIPGLTAFGIISLLVYKWLGHCMNLVTIRKIKGPDERERSYKQEFVAHTVTDFIVHALFITVFVLPMQITGVILQCYIGWAILRIIVPYITNTQVKHWELKYSLVLLFDGLLGLWVLGAWYVLHIAA